EELGELDGDAGWDAQAWAEAMSGYFAEYDRLGTGPDARGPTLLAIVEEAEQWHVRQTFDDPDGDRDWGISAVVDLAESDATGAAVVSVTDVGMYDGS